jgi:hypothetical protein
MSRYRFKNDADEAVSVVSLTSSSGGYINGRNSANLELLIDKTSSLCVSFGGILFQQVIGIPMGTNCATLLADLFLYSYESEFFQKFVKDKKIHEARAFNFTYRYNDDVLSWPLHSESIARCKHHMQEKLVYCSAYLENL